MNKRVVVSVATGHYGIGQRRLVDAMTKQGEVTLWSGIQRQWPSHEAKPYAFKAYALKEAADMGFDTLIWADACILPIRSMAPLWERIERDGYWFSNNGYTNYEWTADSAYPDLFPEWPGPIERASAVNRLVKHVVATTFGISLKHELGRKFLAEYFRLASETSAFCGPWKNRNWPEYSTHEDARTAVCGPADVRGHRHDQTAASVIAWRLGFQLTDAPEIFAYKGGETERTILIADGAY